MHHKIVYQTDRYRVLEVKRNELYYIDVLNPSNKWVYRGDASTVVEAICIIKDSENMRKCDGKKT